MNSGARFIFLRQDNVLEGLVRQFERADSQVLRKQQKRKPHCMIRCSGVMGDGGHAVRRT